MYIFVKANEYGVDFILCAETEEEIRKVFISQIAITIEDELERRDIFDGIDEFLESVGEKGDYDCYADAIYDGGHYHEFLDWLYKFDDVGVNGERICHFGNSEEGNFFEFSWYDSKYWMV